MTLSAEQLMTPSSVCVHFTGEVPPLEHELD